MAGRTGGPKVKNNGRWTQARFNSFIKSMLRGGSRKWQPISDCLKAARTRRGFYECADCREEVTASKKVDGKRVKNVHVDHIDPVVDPNTGFISWDNTIERMFCEPEGLQLLCDDCHKVKTDIEKAIAKQRREDEKLV